MTEHHVFLVGPHALCVGSAVGDGADHVPTRRGVCQSSKRLKSVNALRSRTSASPSFSFALQSVPALGLQRNFGTVFVTSVNASGAATAWPMTLSLGWFRTFS